jgi:hypothetical protein
MAAKNMITAVNGPMKANRSCRLGVCRRHHPCHSRLISLNAERGRVGEVMVIECRTAMPTLFASLQVDQKGKVAFFWDGLNFTIQK